MDRDAGQPAGHRGQPRATAVHHRVAHDQRHVGPRDGHQSDRGEGEGEHRGATLAARTSARQAATRRAGVRVASLGWRAMDIEGNGALVVGGASGLGEATARRLHAQGAALTIADVNAEKGEALADELGVAFVACDVREEDQVQAAVEAAAAADGGLRICVCCAGTGFAQKIAGSRGPHAARAVRGHHRHQPDRDLQRPALRLERRCWPTSRSRTASAACASTPRRSPPTTARSARSPTAPRRAAWSA